MSYTLPNETGQWNYRIPVTYSNTGGATNGLQVNITLDNTFNYGACLTGGVDIRITDSDGQTILPHYIESWNSSTSASIWFKVNLPDSSNHTAYLYYGNPQGTPVAPSATSVPPIGPWSHSNSYITTSGTAVSNICPESMILVGSTYYMAFENRTSFPITIGLMHASDPTSTTDWVFDSNIISTSGQNEQSPFLYQESGTFYVFWWHHDNTIHYATASSVTGPYTDQGSIIPKGSSGAWDSATTYEPCLVPNYDGNGNYAMLYTGSSGSGPGFGNEQVGLATASAISGPWTKQGTGPVIPCGSKGSIDYQFCADAWYGGKFGNTHYIGYIAGPATANVGEPWGQSYVTTTDWVTFTKSNKMTFCAGAAGRWDQSDGHRGHPIQVGTQWVQLYIGCSTLGESLNLHAGVMLAPASLVQDVRNNADAVFDFWDGFDGSSLNLQKWSTSPDLVVNSVSGSIADITSSGGNGSTVCMAGSTAFPKNVVCEANIRFKSASGTTNSLDFGLGESNVADNSLILAANGSAMEYSYYNGGRFVGWNSISGAPYDTTNYHKAQIYWDGTTVTYSLDGQTSTATPSNMTYNTAFTAFFYLYRNTTVPEMLIDWVRIRKWPGSESSVSLGPVQTSSGSDIAPPTNLVVSVT